MARKKKVERKLTEKEMSEMEKAHLEKRLRKAELKEIEYKSRILALENELKTMKINLERKRLSEKDEILSSQHKVFVDEIRERLGIDGDFGYNPDTGEITE